MEKQKYKDMSILKSVIISVVIIAFSSCSSEENDLTQFDSCSIYMTEGDQAIDYINIKSEETSSMTYLGKEYSLPFTIKKIIAPIKISFNHYISNIDLIFNIVNNTDSIRKINMDIYCTDSKTGVQTKRNIITVLQQNQSITFRRSYKKN